MENVIYDVDYFIKKFEAIPDKKWMERSQGERGVHCAAGHCRNNNGRYGAASANPTACDYSHELFCLKSLFDAHGIHSITVGSKHDSGGWNIADVNNGDNPLYQQPTPKQRILAALYDIKKMQEPIPSPKPQKEYVIVHVDKTIPEQARKLTEALN